MNREPRMKNAILNPPQKQLFIRQRPIKPPAIVSIIAHPAQRKIQPHRNIVFKRVERGVIISRPSLTVPLTPQSRAPR